MFDNVGGPKGLNKPGTTIMKNHLQTFFYCLQQENKCNPLIHISKVANVFLWWTYWMKGEILRLRWFYNPEDNTVFWSAWLRRPPGSSSETRRLKLVLIIVRRPSSPGPAVILLRPDSLNVRAAACRAPLVSPYMDPGMNFFHRPGLFTQFTKGPFFSSPNLIPRPAHPGLL